MMLSKQKLIQIINEVLGDLEDETTPQEDVDALGDFSSKLLDASKLIKNTKGLDAAEMNQILDIFTHLVKLSSRKTAAPVLHQITDIISKKTGMPDES